MLILGFGNKARHGKDTAGLAVVDFYSSGVDTDPLRVKQFRFAQAIYQECRDIHGMTEKDAPLLQRVGQARRTENPDYWVEKVFSTIPADLDIAVITDVRYLNEAQAIKGYGGYAINVTRLNQNGSKYVADDRPMDHPSETELDYYNWDFQIVAKSGQSVLVAEQAITIAKYIW